MFVSISFAVLLLTSISLALKKSDFYKDPLKIALIYIPTLVVLLVDYLMLKRRFESHLDIYYIVLVFMMQFELKTRETRMYFSFLAFSALFGAIIYLGYRNVLVVYSSLVSYLAILLYVAQVLEKQPVQQPGPKKYVEDVELLQDRPKNSNPKPLQVLSQPQINNLQETIKVDINSALLFEGRSVNGQSIWEQGLLVLDRSMKPIYCNSQAQKLISQSFLLQGQDKSMFQFIEMNDQLEGSLSSGCFSQISWLQRALTEKMVRPFNFKASAAFQALEHIQFGNFQQLVRVISKLSLNQPVDQSGIVLDSEKELARGGTDTENEPFVHIQSEDELLRIFARECKKLSYAVNLKVFNCSDSEIWGIQYPIMCLEFFEVSPGVMAQVNQHYLESNLHVFKVLTHDLKTPIGCAYNMLELLMNTISEKGVKEMYLEPAINCLKLSQA